MSANASCSVVGVRAGAHGSSEIAGTAAAGTRVTGGTAPIGAAAIGAAASSSAFPTRAGPADRPLGGARGSRHGRDGCGGAGEGARDLVGELVQRSAAPRPATGRPRSRAARAEAARAAERMPRPARRGSATWAAAAASIRHPAAAAGAGRRGPASTRVRTRSGCDSAVKKREAFVLRLGAARAGASLGPDPAARPEADDRRPHRQQEGGEHRHPRTVAERRPDAMAGDDHGDPHRDDADPGHQREQEQPAREPAEPQEHDRVQDRHPRLPALLAGFAEHGGQRERDPGVEREERDQPDHREGQGGGTI